MDINKPPIFISLLDINLVILYFILIKQVGDLENRQIFLSTAKIIVLSILMGLSVQLVKHQIAPWLNMQTFWGVLIQVLIAVIVGGIFYFIMSLACRCEEVKILKDYLKKLKIWK